MLHHKRAAEPQTFVPTIPSLLCFKRSALVSCTRPGRRAVKGALAQRAWAVHRCSKLYTTGPYLVCSAVGLPTRSCINRRLDHIKLKDYRNALLICSETLITKDDISGDDNSGSIGNRNKGPSVFYSPLGQ